MENTRSAFKRLICNLLLDIHPIVAARFTHPLIANLVHQFYLNFRTVYNEYRTTKRRNRGYNKVNNIYEALDIMVRHGDNIVAVKWLLKNINKTMMDCTYADTFRTAVYKGHKKIVKLLLFLNIKSNPYINLNNALSETIENNYLEIAKLLLEAGAIAQ